jgi:hypothetical protein
MEPRSLQRTAPGVAIRGGMHRRGGKNPAYYSPLNSLEDSTRNIDYSLLATPHDNLFPVMLTKVRSDVFQGGNRIFERVFQTLNVVLSHGRDGPTIKWWPGVSLR